MSKSTTTHKEEARGNVRFLIAMGIFGILVVMFAFILLSPDTHTKNAQLRQNDVVVRFYVLSSSYPKPKHKYYRDTGVAPRVILIGVSEIMP